MKNKLNNEVQHLLDELMQEGYTLSKARNPKAAVKCGQGFGEK